MGKSIKNMTYEIIDGKMVWRMLKPGKKRGNCECKNCQLPPRKKKKEIEQIPEINEEKPAEFIQKPNE